MTPPSAEDQLHDLCRAVARARGAVLDGGPIEFAGLDDEVARVSDLARNAPSAERDSVLAAMNDLAHELDGLADDLRRRHDADLAQLAAGAYAGDLGRH